MRRPPKSVFYIATATAQAVLGDTLLYTVLPSYYLHIGLVPYQVGILLSANRWVRLATNHLSVKCCRRFPSELWLLASVFSGALVSAVYGTVRIFIILLGARILWGFAFSFIRQASILTVVKSGDQSHLGERMGYYSGISSLWQGVGVILGGMSHDLFGFPITMIGLSIFALSGVYFANLSQRDLKGMNEAFFEAQMGKGNFGTILCGFSVGMVITGLIMSTLGWIVKERLGTSFNFFGTTVGVVTLTGMILSMRWILDAIGAPFLGAAADLIGRERSVHFLFLLGGIALFAGVLPMGTTWLILDVFLFFICGTMLHVLLVGQAGRIGAKNLASYVTAVDLGSSLGPIIGWGMVQFGLSSHIIFFMAGIFFLVGGIVSYRSL